MKKNLWTMPEEEFKDLVSEITVSDAFLNIMTFGLNDTADKDKESILETARKFGFKLKTPEIARFINNINRRLLAP